MVLRNLSLRLSTRTPVVSLVERFVRKNARSQSTSGRREVALTFDDGPHAEWTPRILDALDRAGAKATFFVVGQAVQAHGEIVKDARRRGHEIGTHLHTHERGTVYDDGAFRAELRRATGDLEALLGEPTLWLRFPYGERGKQDPEAIVREHGVTAVHWTYSSHDTRAKSPFDVEARFAAGLRKGAIVLFHDALFDEKTAPPPYVGARDATVAALPRIGSILATRGLRAVTLSALFRSPCTPGRRAPFHAPEWRERTGARAPCPS